MDRAYQIECDNKRRDPFASLIASRLNSAVNPERGIHCFMNPTCRLINYHQLARPENRASFSYEAKGTMRKSAFL
jgi:hypothetical protein